MRRSENNSKTGRDGLKQKRDNRKGEKEELRIYRNRCMLIFDVLCLEGGLTDQLYSYRGRPQIHQSHVASGPHLSHSRVPVAAPTAHHEGKAKALVRPSPLCSVRPMTSVRR